jgi:hypothetical protein
MTITINSCSFVCTDAVSFIYKDLARITLQQTRDEHDVFNADKKGRNLSLVEAKIPDVVRIYVYNPVFNELFIPFSRSIC